MKCDESHNVSIFILQLKIDRFNLIYLKKFEKTIK